MEILYEYIPAIMEWCEVYMKEEPTAGNGEIEFKRYSVKAADICIDPTPLPSPAPPGLVTAAVQVALQ